MTIYVIFFLKPPDFNKIWKTFWHKFANYQCLEPHVLTAVSGLSGFHRVTNMVHNYIKITYADREFKIKKFAYGCVVLFDLHQYQLNIGPSPSTRAKNRPSPMPIAMA